MIAEDLLTKDQAELYNLMSAISEEGYFAAWVIGNEFAIWQMIQEGSAIIGHVLIDRETLQKCKELSDKIGGWIVWWDDDNDPDLPVEDWGPRFIPMADWLEMFSKYSQKEVA